MCYASRQLPRGWGRMILLTARIFPALRDIEVNVEDRLLSKIVRRGTIVFDIGANIGYYTRYLSNLLGNCGLVVAVEPMPRALRLLQRNAELARSSIKVIPCAVGECHSRGTLHEAVDLDTSRVRFTGGDDMVGVEVVAIDALADEYGQPDLIKLDIEGAELQALRGAKQVLSGPDPPVILFEYIDHNAAHYEGYALRDVVQSLMSYKQAGYIVFRVGSPMKLMDWDTVALPGLTNDYLAVPLCKSNRLGSL